MGDWKMECPGCNAWTDSVGIAYRDGNDCPSCGLLWSATDAVLTARQKYKDDERTEKLEAAEVRAGQAERDRDQYLHKLGDLRWQLRSLLSEIDEVMETRDGR
jgi:hypothetical protein